MSSAKDITGRRRQAAIWRLACRTVATLLLASIALTPHTLVAGVRSGITTIALSGDQAVELNGQLTSLGAGGINDLGQVTFSANVSSHFSYWSGTHRNDYQLLEYSGQTVPGLDAGVTIKGTTGTPTVNSTNQSAAMGTLIGQGVTTSNDEFMWVGSPSLDGVLVREGSPAPLTGGVNFGTLFSSFQYDLPAMNRQGQIAFQTGLQSSSGTSLNSQVNWVTDGAQLTAIAATGGPAPGLAAGGTYNVLFPNPAINDNGTTVFKASFNNPNGVITTGTGIWSATNGTVTPVALPGDAAPGFVDGVTLRPSSYFAGSNSVLAQGTKINAAGETIFQATLAGPGINTSGNTNSSSVWVGGAQTGLTLVAQGDSLAPGLPHGGRFFSFLDGNVSDKGTVALIAQYAGATQAPGQGLGLWVGSPGHLQLLAINGTTIADGNNAPAVLSIGYLASDYQGALVGNSLGELLLPNQPGMIVGADPWGHLSVIARAGDSLEVAPGDFRTISTISYDTNTYMTGGGSTPLNDRGQVAFTAKFTDGSSGVFVSNALVPLAGDTNGDGIVNGQDIAAVASNWLGNPASMADVNNDRIINGQDIALIASNWLGTRDDAGIATAAAVPEPASIVLLVVGAIVGGLFSQRKRRARV